MELNGKSGEYEGRSEVEDRRGGRRRGSWRGVRGARDGERNVERMHGDGDGSGDEGEGEVLERGKVAAQRT